MTETTGAFTTNTAGNFKLGTVGRPLPGVEVRIAADGEVLARAPLCTPGYLNLPEATAALIDADGWLHTGDIGALDEDGFLSITGRKKEMIITAGGENVAPAGVEGLLTQQRADRPGAVLRRLAPVHRRPARRWTATRPAAGPRPAGSATWRSDDLAAHPDLLTRRGRGGGRRERPACQGPADQAVAAAAAGVDQRHL